MVTSCRRGYSLWAGRGEFKGIVEWYPWNTGGEAILCPLGSEVGEVGERSDHPRFWLGLELEKWVQSVTSCERVNPVAYTKVIPEAYQ